MNRELMYTVEEYNSTSSFFLAIEWNANIMAGTKVAISEHEMKAMCWVWLSN